MSAPGAIAASESLTVYDSASQGSKALAEAWALWEYRGLVHELVLRDIKIRYKRSVVWTTLAPLLNMVALTLVFSTILKQQISNYPVFFMRDLLGVLRAAHVVRGIADAGLERDREHDVGVPAGRRKSKPKC